MVTVALASHFNIRLGFKEKAPLIGAFRRLALHFDYVFRLRASVGVFHLEAHLVPLSKTFVAFHGDGREMNKQILPLFPLDKPIPLIRIKPLHNSLCQSP
jgi:hypothetical protein